VPLSLWGFVELIPMWYIILKIEKMYGVVDGIHLPIFLEALANLRKATVSLRNDLRKMGVTNCKQRTQERKQWIEVIEQAKTHKEL